MTLALVLLATLAADALTFLFLPPGSERNSLVLILGPGAAIALRLTAAAILIGLAFRAPRWREPLLLPGIVAASIGAGANLSVLL